MFATALLPINVRRLWLFNFGLMILYVSLSVGFPFLKGSVLEYPNAKPPAFNGTVRPIAYVPNWLVAGNMNKSLRYEDVAASDFIELPVYDPQTLEIEDTTDKIALMARATYITPYMGSYRMNFKEYDGSHLGTDIRAPLGTPVMAMANGVVTKVVNTENADGKYVIIRHDGIVYDGRPKASYYSSYLHLEAATAVEGTVVKKGDVIGRVGMTGITTTPHLHFQIDTADAPFHAYWPYSFQDLRNLGIDFFEAVNLGLGKENAMKYTVNPVEFVQSLVDASFSVEAPNATEIKVAGSAPTSGSQNYVTPVPVVVPPTKTPEKVPDELTSAPVLPGPVTTPTVLIPANSGTAAANAAKAFIDVSDRAVYATAAKYLKAKAVPAMASESVFRPAQSMSRRDAVLYLAGVFSIDPQVGVSSPFADIPADDASLGYVAAFQARGIISGGWLFRPNDAITKTELVAMLLRITNDYQAGFELYGTNGPVKKFVADTKFSRAAVQSNKAVTRADGARMIQAWGVLKRG